MVWAITCPAVPASSGSSPLLQRTSSPTGPPYPKHVGTKHKQRTGHLLEAPSPSTSPPPAIQHHSSRFVLQTTSQLFFHDTRLTAQPSPSRLKSPHLRDHVDITHVLICILRHLIMSGNGWLARQRKSDLVDMTQALGLEYVATVFFHLHLHRHSLDSYSRIFPKMISRGILWWWLSFARVLVCLCCDHVSRRNLHRVASPLQTCPSHDPKRVATHTIMLSWHHLTRDSCAQI
jgi:hypothetical protein